MSSRARRLAIGDHVMLSANAKSLGKFILYRIAISALTIFTASIISFIIIQLPPGDFVSSYIAQLSQTGAVGSTESIEQLRADYGLDKPMVVQYGMWAVNAIQGDFGMSLQWNRDVNGLIGEYIGLTLMLALMGLLFAWGLALPIGLYNSMHRGSVADYAFSIIGMIGIAVPNFLLALFALFIGFRYFNADLGMIHSPRYIDAPWSLGKFFDALLHMIVPALILALPIMSRLVRVLRANLLDEMSKSYVVTARAKGMHELRLVLKYPTRIALNPFISTIGLTLPILISGSIIVSMVLNIPTLGPLLLQALQGQDMFLASAILLILATLAVVGTLVSDLLLSWIDPRIRLQS